MFRQPWYIAAFGKTAGADLFSSIIDFMTTYSASYAAGRALSHWQARCFSSTRIMCNSDHWQVTEPVLLSLLQWWVHCLLQLQNRAARASAMVDAWASVFLRQGNPRFSNDAWSEEAIRRGLPPQYLVDAVPEGFSYATPSQVDRRLSTSNLIQKLRQGRSPLQHPIGVSPSVLRSELIHNLIQSWRHGCQQSLSGIHNALFLIRFYVTRRDDRASIVSSLNIWKRQAMSSDAAD